MLIKTANENLSELAQTNSGMSSLFKSRTDDEDSNLSICSDSVHFHLCGALYELCDDDRVILRYLGGLAQVDLQLFVIERHVHGRAAQNVGGTQQTRVANTGSKFQGLVLYGKKKTHKSTIKVQLKQLLNAQNKTTLCQHSFATVSNWKNND